MQSKPQVWPILKLPRNVPRPLSLQRIVTDSWSRLSMTPVNTVPENGALNRTGSPIDHRCSFTRAGIIIMWSLGSLESHSETAGSNKFAFGSLTLGCEALIAALALLAR